MEFKSKLSLDADAWANWLKRTLRWLGYPRLIWFTAVVLLSGLGACLYSQSQRAVNWIGLDFQLLGIFTVGWNILKSRKQFGRTGVLQLTARWWGERPSFRAPTVNIVINAVAPAATASGRGESWYEVDPNLSSGERMGKLEANQAIIRQRLQMLEILAEKQANSLEVVQSQAHHLRIAGEAEIHRKLEESVLGGIGIAGIGVIYLTVGLIMSTLSGDLGLHP